MFHRQKFPAIILAAGIALAASTAAAQDFSPFNPKPTVSPYLLLLQNDGSNSSNVGTGNYGVYQNLVRPMLDRQDNRVPTGQSPYSPGGIAPNLSARSPQTTGVSTSVRATGHAATFQNTLHYYNNSPYRRVR